MAVVRPRIDDYDDGYPGSADADLDPGPNLTESLDAADRATGQEHRVAPSGQRPDGSIEDEERFEDADEVDDAESLHQLAGGRV